MNVVIYARYSSHSQTEQSIEGQLQTCYEFAKNLELDFVLKTVHILIQKHGVSLNAHTLAHSAQGCHYTSLRVIQILKDSNLRQSMSLKGNYWNNAPQESFFGHMKDKIDLSVCESFDQVKAISMIGSTITATTAINGSWLNFLPMNSIAILPSGLYPLPDNRPSCTSPGST